MKNKNNRRRGAVRRGVSPRSGAAMATMGVLLTIAAMPANADRQVLSGHIPRAVGESVPVAALPEGARLNLAVALPLRNQGELNQLLSDLYNPWSPRYQQYLTAQQFEDEFSPTQAQYNAVLAYLQAHGLTVTSTTENRKLIDVTGTAADIENALQIGLLQYQRPDGRVFYAPDREPSVDSVVAASVESISGLDNADPPHPMLQYAPNTVVARQTGSGPGGGLTPKDLRTAYNVPSSLTGSGQTLALFEFGPYSPSDISYYESYYGLPNVPITNVLLDGVTNSGSPSGEDTLDMDVMLAYCPNMTKLMVYEGNNDLDILNRVASDNQAKVLSISYGWSTATSEYQSENSVYQQLASEGISVFVASGDSGSWTSSQIINPADQPYVTSVGGTTLTTSGAGGAYSSEKAWSGSGGGASTFWSIPSYQSGVPNLASSSYRNAPDVSDDADPASAYSVYLNGSWALIGGTSGAAPSWASAIALVNQQRASKGAATLGFINPTIYNLGKGSTYHNDFHDITSGSDGQFTAVSSFDCATGWGSPNVTNLANDLTPSSASVTAGVHTLTPACATGSRLDDNASGTTNGNKIQIWGADNTQAQNWNFASVGTNTWNIAVNLGPYCLDGGAAKVGTAVQLWGCNGTPDQAWVSGPAAQSGYFNFASKQSGLCLDVNGAGTANGTVVQSYTCNGTTAQAWAVH